MVSDFPSPLADFHAAGEGNAQIRQAAALEPGRAAAQQRADRGARAV